MYSLMLHLLRAYCEPGSGPAVMGRDLAQKCCQAAHSPEGEGDFRSGYKMLTVLKRRAKVLWEVYTREAYFNLGSGVSERRIP